MGSIERCKQQCTPVHFDVSVFSNTAVQGVEKALSVSSYKQKPAILMLVLETY